MAFRIPNRGVVTHSACSQSATVYLANHNRTTESGDIGGVKLLYNLLTVSTWVSSHLVTLVKVKKSVDVGDSVQAPYEDSALLCNNSGHLLFVINHLGIPIDLPLALNTPYWPHHMRLLVHSGPDPVGRLGIDPGEAH
ncbi:hypothetical protein H5410_035714 [Solanum commersonii]|uniref:Uncharacterized protein n=1 Tax=Solanum commersonii TaxID=4109 RepID=A0A9J5Y3E4_SOLCO|nr:hypothetical protein H5410_035714 [Solanum commersonii]